MTNETVMYRFGSFELSSPQLGLKRNGQSIKLGGRALGLLAVLAEAGGELVSRDRLLERVWPGQSVDEAVVRVHLSNARRALAEGGAETNTIVNDAGRGYRLGIPVERVSLPQQEPGATSPITAGDDAKPLASLPSRIAKMLGRDHLIPALVNALEERRFITIAGAGGIGKTTVAVAVAKALAEQTAVATYFVDLGPSSDPGFLPGMVAKAMGLPPGGSDILTQLIRHASARPTMIVLDNCEHLVDAAAELSETLLQAIPCLLLLTTSREPLRAEGEWVHRLSSLDLPQGTAAQDVASALSHSAIALFCERALAVNDEFDLNRETLPAVVEICARLDGIPLAIELAAARSDAMPPSLIASGIDDRFNLLTRGRRTALARHRTLRAAMDWSHALLEPCSQAVLHRLALFRSNFTAEDAIAVASADYSSAEIHEALSELVAKSLVNVVRRDAGVAYRLLETTRHYGLERLQLAGRTDTVRRDHIGFLLRCLVGSNLAWEGRASHEWLAAHGRHIDDVRCSLAWAIEECEDRTFAVELTIASSALWFHLSLAREFLQHVQAVQVHLDDTVPPDRRAALLLSYGHALWHTLGPVPEMQSAFEGAYDIAASIDSRPLLLRALWGRWAFHTLAGDYSASLEAARHFGSLAAETDEPANHRSAKRMQVLSHHFGGDHRAALALLEEVLASDEGTVRANVANHAQVDGLIAAHAVLMRIRWIMGDMEGALDLAKASVEDCLELDHALSLCYSLAIGCIPVAIAAGRTELAADWLGLLRECTDRHDLDYWGTFAAGYSAALEGREEIPPRATKMQREMFAVASGKARDVPWYANELCPAPLQRPTYRIVSEPEIRPR